MRGLPYSIGLLLAAVWIAPLSAQEPTGSIRGHVTDDATQQPLRGATVRVGNRNTQTRADGAYLLPDVPAGTDSLRVSMIGYAPAARAVTVAAGEILDVDVGLAPQAVNLAELVVVGYGEQRQGNVTGAVTNVTEGEFNTGRVVTPTELIQNKVAGVQVVENTEPGGKTSIRIRGGTSTNASNEPLYVIDGAPLGTDAGGGVTSGRDPLNFLNPDDIASITVLRDAGAAAIYGTNAANGVVLITTKRGEAGQKPKFEYTGSASASSVTRVPSMLNAAAVPHGGGAACAGQRRPAAEREHRLVRRHRPDRIRPGAQPRRVGRRPGHGLSRLLQLPRPERHHRPQQHPAHRPGGELQPAARQRPPQPALQLEGLSLSRQIHPPRGALQCGAVRPDSADHRSQRGDGFLRLARQ